MKIVFQRSKCIGCNYCIEANPERWRISKKDGKCVLIGGRQKGRSTIATVFEHERPANELAVRVCPVKCIWMDDK